MHSVHLSEKHYRLFLFVYELLDETRLAYKHSAQLAEVAGNLLLPLKAVVDFLLPLQDRCVAAAYRDVTKVCRLTTTAK